MRIRPTIREVVLLAVTAALSVGWRLDHRQMASELAYHSKYQRIIFSQNVEKAMMIDGLDYGSQY